MKDSSKTKARLLKELTEMRQRITSSEALEIRYKQIEKALHHSEAKLRTFIESASDGFLLLDSNLDIIDTKRHGLTDFGLAEKDLLGKNLLDIAPSTRETGRYEQYRKVLQTGIPFAADEAVPDLRFGGEDKRMSLRAFKIGDNLGIISTDITERKRAEETLKESEKRYRLLAENAADIIWTMDMELRVTYVSPSVKRMLGYDVEEVIAQTVSVLPAASSQIIKKAFRGQLALENPRRKDASRSWTQVHKLACNNGSTIWAESTVTFLRNADGQPVAILGVTRDITARKWSEEALRHSESRLRLLSKRIIEVQEEERARIARELHDQLGQELVALKIELIWLAEQLTGIPALDERARTALALVDRLDATAHRIAISIRPEMLDQLGLAKTIQWYAENFERRSGISCPVETPTCQLTLDRATATCAYRIVQEALTNVRKHANASQAKVKIVTRDGKVSIRVSDNGVGVDQKQLADASSLGLLGMRERARLVGGKVTIMSSPGRGFRVVADLPMKRSEQAQM